jgi:hypothetical protein
VIEVAFDDIPELIRTNKIQVCGAIAIYTMAAMYLKNSK